MHRCSDQEVSEGEVWVSPEVEPQSTEHVQEDVVEWVLRRRLDLVHMYALHESGLKAIRALMSTDTTSSKVTRALR